MQAQPLFSDLSSETLAKAANLFTALTVSRGETIVREGDWVDSIYFFDVGKAQVMRSFSNMEVIHIAILHPNDAIGLSESGFYSTTFKRFATVVTTEDSCLFRLDIKHFEYLSKIDSNLNTKLTKKSKELLWASFIQNISAFAGLELEAHLALAEKVTEKTIPANSLIIKEGDVGNECYLLRNGAVRVFRGDTEITTLNAPAVFGEKALLTNATRNASIEAITDCQLLVLHRDDLLEFFKFNSDRIAAEINFQENAFPGFTLTKEGWIIYR